MEHKLHNGWVATLIPYFTQGQFEQLQDAMLEGLTVGSDGKVSDIPVSRIRQQSDLALKLAVIKLLSPSGEVFEGDRLTLEVIKSMPYDPDFPAGELNGLVNELTGKKKATSAN